MGLRAFAIQIVPSALAELQAIKAFYRGQIVQAIDERLPHQPLVPTRNRKPLPDVEPSFACQPPLWELRVGDYRVFYDVDEADQTVYVRAVRDKPPHATTEEVV
jgi:mRNA-degrading endonuclease RelE of RelBE toxin-antitoxin system